MLGFVRDDMEWFPKSFFIYEIENWVGSCINFAVGISKIIRERKAKYEGISHLFVWFAVENVEENEIYRIYVSGYGFILFGLSWIVGGK